MSSPSPGPEGNAISGIRRMIDLFFNSELMHDDFTNDLVVLGRAYSANPGTDAGVAVADQATVPEPREASPADAEDTGTNNESSFFMVEERKPWPAGFVADVNSKIWITYRTGFPPIPYSEDGPSALSITFASFLRSGTLNDFNAGFTSDVGWGCMIRTSQMLLANALLILEVGRDWRLEDGGKSEPLECVVDKFVDRPESPFSIHHFVEEGKHSGKRAGEWFGPTAASRSIQIMCNTEDSKLRAYLTEDGGDLYEEEFFAAARGQDGVFKPTLILSALRLGVDNVNPLYWNSLRKSLQVDQAVGIAGGRPKSSHYFFGFQGDYLFYFDPHLPQKCPKDAYDQNGINYDTYRSTKFKKLHLKDMDPSMLIGFLITSEQDFDSWKQSMQQQDCKLFHFTKAKTLQRLREPSIVEVDDDEGFIDLGYDGTEPRIDEDEEAETQYAVADAEDAEDAELVESPQEEDTEPVMVEERRFSEPVMVEDVDLQSDLTKSSQVFENISSSESIS